MPRDTTAATAESKRQRAWEKRAKCNGIKKDGGRCRSFANPKSGFCYFHDPSISDAEKHEAARIGGRHGKVHRLRKLIPPRLLTVYEQLERALIETYDGRISPNRATAMASVAQAMVRVLERGELEQKVRDLEQAVRDEEGEVVIEESV